MWGEQMRSALTQFVDALAMAFDAVALQDALSMIGAKMELPLFAYFLIGSKHQRLPLLISNYALEWTDRYIDREYHNLDPVIARAKAQIDPFSWDSNVDDMLHSPEQREFFEEAKTFGIRRGFTVPLTSSAREFAAVTFASGENDAEARRSIEMHGSALHLIGLLFHRRAEMLASGNRRIAGVTLTKREIECLSWAMLGKSTWDTAQIIGIRPRTVSYHLSNIRTKLEVKTITQAVAIVARAQREQTL